MIILDINWSEASFFTQTNGYYYNASVHPFIKWILEVFKNAFVPWLHPSAGLRTRAPTCMSFLQLEMTFNVHKVSRSLKKGLITLNDSAPELLKHYIFQNDLLHLFCRFWVFYSTNTILQTEIKPYTSKWIWKTTLKGSRFGLDALWQLAQRPTPNSRNNEIEDQPVGRKWFVK